MKKNQNPHLVLNGRSQKVPLQHRRVPLGQNGRKLAVISDLDLGQFRAQHPVQLALALRPRPHRSRTFLGHHELRVHVAYSRVHLAPLVEDGAQLMLQVLLLAQQPLHVFLQPGSLDSAGDDLRTRIQQSVYRPKFIVLRFEFDS